MLLLLGFFLTLLATPVEASHPPHVLVSAQANSISGFVFNDHRNPLPDLQIELLNEVDSVIQRTKTDGSGQFSFRRLTTGIFQIRVQTYGTSYVGQTKRVQLEPTRAFEQADFILVSGGTSATTSGGTVFVQRRAGPGAKRI